MKKIYSLLAALSISLASLAQAPWTQQAVGFNYTTAYPSDIEIVDANTVWVCSTPGDGSGVGLQEFSRTINGGSAWSAGTVTIDTNYRFANLAATSADTCWAAMYNNSAGGGALFQTVNGGVNWNQVGAGTLFAATASFPNVIHFFDSNNGFTMGDPIGGYYEIYTTSDAGVTWTRTPQANIPAPVSGEFGIVNDFCTVGNTVWFGTNRGRVYKSTDRGLTWTVTNVVNTTNTVSIVAFADANNGLAVKTTTTGAATTFATSDGGTTWTQITPVGPFFSGEVVYVPGTSVAFSASASATARGSSYSFDGINWNLLDTLGAGTSDGYPELEFIDATTGWAGGFSQGSSADGIYRWTGGTVGLNENNEAVLGNVTVYPNPGNGLFRYMLPQDFSGEGMLTVTDLQGRTMLQQEIQNVPGMTLSLDLRNQADGVYLMKLVQANGFYQSRLVKQ